jgi:hypothetical protein
LEDIMHPMFVKLFLETSADDPLADEEDERRRASRARRDRVTRSLEGHRSRPGSPAATMTCLRAPCRHQRRDD